MAVLLMQTPGALGTRPAPGGPDLVGYLLTCALVLGLVLGAAWMFRRFLAGSLRAKAARRSLRVVDVLPLGGRQRLVVVRCYDRTFLLGQGEKEVRAISELDVQDEPIDTPAVTGDLEQSAGPQAQRAATAFARLLGRSSAQVTPERQTVPHTKEPRSSESDRGALPRTDERPKHPVLEGGKGILG